jgi:hypothetical protein
MAASRCAEKPVRSAWRSNAPRVESDLTSLIISHQGARGDPWYEIYRLSKAALVRGAFAIQCRNPFPLGWLTLLTAVTTCIHFSPPYRLPFTGESSDLAIKILNELCCRKLKVQWKAERETLRLMCGSAGSEKHFLIHPFISSKCTVPNK